MNNIDERIIFASIFKRYLIPIYVVCFTIMLFFAFDFSFEKEAVEIYVLLIILSALISLVIFIRNKPDIIINKDGFYTKIQDDTFVTKRSIFIKWNNLKYITIIKIESSEDGLVESCLVFIDDYKKHEIVAEKYNELVACINFYFPSKYILQNKYEILKSILSKSHTQTLKELNEKLIQNNFEPFDEDAIVSKDIIYQTYQTKN